MELLMSASFIASFFAGVAALFAPCCITVLLPTYFASIFKEKGLIFFMTFIYFLGVLAVFLPLGLGATFISQIFSLYHNTIFFIGGVFLIFLGLTMLLGKQFSLPFTVHPSLKNYNIPSVFTLGVFSGIATTCCAPVLAGVLTLAVLPGSVILGGVYTLAYVLGMVVPLFIIALTLDKFNFTQKFFGFRKATSYTLFGQKIRLTFANLFSGLVFLIFGIIILYLERTNQLLSHASYQVTVNLYLTRFVRFLENFTKFIPETLWAVLFMGVFFLIIWQAIKQFRKTYKTEVKEVKM